MSRPHALEGLRKLEATGRAFGPSAEQGARLEGAQYLVDLGYLDSAVLAELVDSTEPLSSEAHAVEALRGDLERTSWGQLVDGADTPLSSSEILLLRSLLDLEDEQPWLGVPELGELSLRTRVLHHILRCYGLYEGSPGSPYSEQSIRGLTEAGALLGARAGEWGEIVQMLGNSKEAARRFVVAHPYRPLVALSSSREGGDAGLLASADLLDILALPHGFESGRQRLRQLNVPPLQTERQRVVEALRARTETPDPEVSSSWNLFGLRLLQVRLWIAGYYTGRLDSWIGPMTLGAVREALEDQASRGSSPLGSAVTRGLRRVDDRLVALNPALLLLELEAYDLGPHEGAAEKAAKATLARRQREAADAKEERSWWSRAWSTVKSAAKAAWELGRRLYYGVRRVAKSVVEFFRQGMEVIRTAIAGVVHRAVSIVRGAISFAREGIRGLGESLRAFWAWLRGSPTLTMDKAGIAISDSAFDLDVVTVFYGDEPAHTTLEAHTSTFERRMAALCRAFRGIGVALGIVIDLLVTGFSWPLLVFSIGRKLMPSIPSLALSVVS